ncbi:esterase [Nonlabens arenilitoris]|uniref:Esterase n=1 Tax=Nonlabens arenilitoris TaxID=1217969 RepID=A0A2S7UDX8_9FLAO|nr:alpha/beta hydrolase-fold protein [Nonlabens arenilitoris]PQJ32791.1 esterase [Nonlabens arenilitoris]
MKSFYYLFLVIILTSCKDQSPTNVFTPIAATNANGLEIQNPIENDTILYVKNFKSNYVDQRQLEIWLPQGYPLTGVDYKLLYMHDGQNVFNKSSSNYNKAWEIDEKMDSLSIKNLIEPTIVVTTWSHPNKRMNEYMPQQPKELTLSEFAKSELKKNTGYDQLYSDQYLKFVTTEVLPFIRTYFQVSEEPKDNIVMGSSMGGLISLYAMMEYPRTFGNAGCLSTHWPVPFLGEAFIESLPETIPQSKNHRIYFDYGTETLDKDYEPYQLRVDIIFKAKGYNSTNYKSLKYIGHGHDENYWRQRVAPVLIYLLNN